MTISGAVYREGVAYTPDGAVYVKHTDSATMANPTFTGTLTGPIWDSGTTTINLKVNGTSLLNYNINAGNAWQFVAAVKSNAAFTAFSGTATPAGGTAGAGYLLGTTANFGIFYGSGAPTLAAAKGSLYLRSDGSGANDRAYINTDGNTTWTALTTAA